MKPQGNAVVYCEKSFQNTYGKTAHGLVRFTERYRVMAVIDSSLQGEPDAGELLDGKPAGIPVAPNLQRALEMARAAGKPATHFVIGLATDGGYFTEEIRSAVKEALIAGLHVDSGLHDYLQDDRDIAALAEKNHLILRDVRKPSPHSNHMFCGKIEEVRSRKIALLGTDSALGKRTTAWKLVHRLQLEGCSAELIGTGQTSWLQGAQYSMVLDSLVNDYVSGELEHLVWTAWKEQNPEYLIIEGQGSLMNPGYPGGFEILAACRPDGIIMQHAPARKEYDGFPGYPMDSLKDQIFLAEFLSKKKVIAVTINHENMKAEEIEPLCKELEDLHGIPVCDPLTGSMDGVIDAINRL